MVGLAFLVVAAGRALWLPWLGGFLIVADPLQPADAVVVLGGGERDRVEEGARIFNAGLAPSLVVTDSPVDLPGIRSDYADLMAQEARWQGVPATQIVRTPGLVTTTAEEAEAVRTLAEDRGWRSLIVVTDPFHTRRARMNFRRALRNSAVAVIIRPVQGSWYTASSWWRSADGLRETWTEYLKLALYALGYR
ncbi:MAG: YdcF family protein [Anaerolineae bacterium]|nr:YdcF family protein [Anaerolineae bacterium]